METNGKVSCESLGIERKTGDGILIKGHQVACLSVDYNLFDASSGAGNYRGAAGHGLKIDDAEGLVDRGATEDAGVAVKLNRLPAGDHLLDPDNARMIAARTLNLLTQLGSDLGRVGRASAEDNLGFGRQIVDGVHQMRNALLARDATDE